jgi:hypothetical protein
MNEPSEPIERLIYPDDAYVGIGTRFGPDQAIVSRIEPIVKDGGLGPATWFAIISGTKGLLGEINASYLSAIIYQRGQ